MTVDDIPAAAKDDSEDPPAVYLCQVSERLSCGACCGLYNVTGLSRDALQDRLTRRTERFAAVPRTEDGIEEFRRAILGWTPEDRPFPHFHHCPFLGLIGDVHTRVGCLLHPAVPGNDGHDFRYLSFYGAQACRSYFCPTARALPPRYLQVLLTVVDDWYPYGLIITEHRLLSALFAGLENRIGRPLGPDDFPSPSEACRRLRELLYVKLSWPYRRANAPGPCHFFFENGLYPRADIDWPSPVRPEGYCATMFRELESGFGSEQDVRQAQKRLDGFFGRISAALV